MVGDGCSDQHSYATLTTMTLARNQEVLWSLRILVLAIVLLAGGTACKQKPPPDDGKSRTIQRTEYAPEEFGIGRQHTRDKACNQDIDQLLDEIRLCYKERGTASRCEYLQEKNSEKIKRLKNSVRCAR
jgi:hypothetical protein